MFADTDSALPLLGFLDSNTYDSSPVTGDAVTLDIPSDLKGVVFDLIATRFDNHAYSENPRRGVKSRTIGSYTESFTGATGDGSTDGISRADTIHFDAIPALDACVIL